MFSKAARYLGWIGCIQPYSLIIIAVVIPQRCVVSLEVQKESSVAVGLPKMCVYVEKERKKNVP